MSRGQQIDRDDVALSRLGVINDIGQDVDVDEIEDGGQLDTAAVMERERGLRDRERRLNNRERELDERDQQGASAFRGDQIVYKDFHDMIGSMYVRCRDGEDFNELMDFLDDTYDSFDMDRDDGDFETQMSRWGAQAGQGGERFREAEEAVEARRRETEMRERMVRDAEHQRERNEERDRQRQNMWTVTQEPEWTSTSNPWDAEDEEEEDEW